MNILTCRFLLLSILLSFLLHNSSLAQEDILFTKQFSKKIDRFDIEFFLPVEKWLKASPVQEDEYLKYDLVLHSPPNVEARIIIKKDKETLFPNIDIVSTIAHISNNEDDAVIEITEYPSSQSQERYGADFVLYADFKPKASFTTYPNGRMLCMYKEGHALIKYIILYEGSLDPYYKMPLRFSDEPE